MMSRERKMLACIDPATQAGIEIGPLNRPIVTREMGNIRYVDHASTEELRSKYATDPHVEVNRIVDVDFVWGTQTLPELVGNLAPFDYVIASHVIEHVPDFIGWLKEIQTILKPGGIVSLAIPDKRFCFDYFRQLTRPSDVLEAYLYKARQPSPRQVFDCSSSVVTWNGAIAWGEPVEPEDLASVGNIFHAWETARHSFQNQTYCDVHCWVFTPTSFLDLLKILTQLNLFDFAVTQFFCTEGCEFYVSLQLVDSTQDISDRQRIQLENLDVAQQTFSEHDALDALNLQSASIEIQQLRIQLEQVNQQLQQFQDRCQRFQDRVRQLQYQIKKVRAHRDGLRDEVIAMQSSKFWQMRTQWLKMKQFLKKTFTSTLP